MENTCLYGKCQCHITTNRPVTALLPQINREPININADDEHYEAKMYVQINT